MVYKRTTFVWMPLLAVVFSTVLLNSCTDGKQDKKMNVSNTCYVEIVNTIDTVKKILEKNINYKATFYKDNQLDIRSFNYLDDENHPGILFYKPLSELGKDTPANTRKLQIEMSGNYTIDSTYYRITQYRYKNKKWDKFSDQGWMKVTLESTSRKGTDSIRFWQLGQQITNNSFVMAHGK